jgi:hypothetical protein
MDEALDDRSVGLWEFVNRFDATKKRIELCVGEAPVPRFFGQVENR